MPKNGFTLIELLVVVAIIAILSVIGLAIYTDNLKKARDATRRSDIDAIGSALEAHYTIGSANPYPVPLPGWFNTGAIPRDPQDFDYIWNGSTVADPADDSQGKPLSDTFGTARATYTVCAYLENKNGNSKTKGNGTTFDNESGDEARYYCRRNLQ